MKSAGDASLQITRIFDAPRSQVFEWWAQADKLQQWSGCKNCVKCEVDMNFRVGGGFRQKMYLVVDGRECDFTLTATYQEIVVPSRISYVLDMGHQTTRVDIEFFEEAEGTRVVMTQEGFSNPESSQIVLQGTNQSLDQLNSLIARVNAIEETV
jgi:uncharacterized protein YndB with AHSA1/START domain